MPATEQRPESIRDRVQEVRGRSLRVMGLFDKQVGQVVEMLYEFREPFLVDGTKIRTSSGVHATPVDAALAATLDSYG